MSNIWLKTKIWTKSILIGLLVLYALLFVLNNRQPTSIWIWFGTSPEMSPVLMVLVSFIFGVITTLLVRTLMKTIRQIKDLKNRSRVDKLQRENTDMKAKAAMLQTRPDPHNPVPPSSAI